MKRCKQILMAGLISICVLAISSCSKSGGNDTPTTPRFTTPVASGVTTGTSAVIDDTLITSGGGTIVASGICYSTSDSPKITNTSVANSSSGNFIHANITGLTPHTTYHLRAFVTNNSGITTYSNQIDIITYTIGQLVYGSVGVIFYLAGDGKNGLYTTTDIFYKESTNIWGCSGTNIPGTDTTFGTGSLNTKTIVNICSTSSAALYCKNLNILSNGPVKFNITGYYLPSLKELLLMWQNRNLLNLQWVSNQSQFINTRFWSSSQKDANNAYYVDFDFGTFSSNPKSLTYLVRPIHAL